MSAALTPCAECGFRANTKSYAGTIQGGGARAVLYAALDQEATLDAIPGMLPPDMNQRRNMFNTIKEILSASAQLEGECLNRLRRIERLFGLEGEIFPFRATAPTPSTPLLNAERKP